jgi:HrpA-like RNA helicase
VDGDFLLLELKELLTRHPTLKVVLMSATINHEMFINYFNGAPLLSIPGYTYPVTDLSVFPHLSEPRSYPQMLRYLEDIIPAIKYRPPAARSTKKESGDALNAFREEHKSKGLDDASISAIQIISRSDRLDYQVRATSSGVPQ